MKQSIKLQQLKITTMTTTDKSLVLTQETHTLIVKYTFSVSVYWDTISFKYKIIQKDNSNTELLQALHICNKINMLINKQFDKRGHFIDLVVDIVRNKEPELMHIKITTLQRLLITLIREKTDVLNEPEQTTVDPSLL